jgi:hypothetical protein
MMKVLKLQISAILILTFTVRMQYMQVIMVQIRIHGL